jgi:putative addiction module CopG family antidote
MHDNLLTEGAKLPAGTSPQYNQAIRDASLHKDDRMSQAMPPLVSGDLPSDLAQFVRQQVAAGRYQTEVEVVSHGVRLLQEREKKLEELRQMVLPALERLDRGEGIVLEGDDELREFFEAIKRRGKERLANRQNQS